MKFALCSTGTMSKLQTTYVTDNSSFSAHFGASCDWCSQKNLRFPASAAKELPDS